MISTLPAGLRQTGKLSLVSQALTYYLRPSITLDKPGICSELFTTKIKLSCKARKTTIHGE